MSGTSGRRAILDIDGTLVDSNYHHVLAWYRAFADCGRTIPAWKLHRHIGMGSDRFVAEVAGEDFDSERGDRAREGHAEEYGRLINDVELLDGARELVRFLHGDGWEVVLASSADEHEVERYLELLDAGEMLAGWTSSADVDATKPDSDLVETALDGADPAAALMIGDTPWDAIASTRIGVRFIGVLTGGFPEADLREAGASEVHEGLPVLIAALQGAPADADSGG